MYPVHTRGSLLSALVGARAAGHPQFPVMERVHQTLTVTQKGNFYRAEGFPGGSDSKESICNAGDMSQEDPLEKGAATHCSILAPRIPWTEELAGYVHGVTKSQT